MGGVLRSMRVGLIMVVASVVSIAGVAPAAGAQTDAPVTNCVVSLFENEARVAWTGSADEFVVLRQVEGRPTHWRGRTTETSFLDVGPTNFGFVEYRVAPRFDGRPGPTTTCRPITPVPAVVACEVNRGRTVDFVQWLPSDFEGVGRFVIFRSDEGGPFEPKMISNRRPFGDLFGPRLAEGFLNTGDRKNARFQIAFISPEGRIGPRQTCPDRPTIDPVSSCTATIDDDGIIVSWEHPGYPERIHTDPFFDSRRSPGFVVSRRVDDGPTWWRGRVDTDGRTGLFEDLPRNGALEYEIVSVTPFDENNRSAARICDTVDRRG